jgi:hypothetical protein
MVSVLIAFSLAWFFLPTRRLQFMPDGMLPNITFPDRAFFILPAHHPPACDIFGIHFFGMD